MANQNLEIEIKVKDSATGQTKRIKGSFADLEKGLGSINQALGAFGLAMGAKEVVDFAVASVAAARESAAAGAELQAALTASGQASAEYRAHLDALATTLEDTTLFSDEQVQQAEATLVSFKNIGTITPQVTQTMADMGQKMGNLGTAAQTLGILLNNPEQASARLRRQGILLTEQQRDQITAFMNAGNTAGAQGIILDELASKYDGQATAAREAAGTAGDWAVATGRLQEAFGGLLLAIGDAGVGGAAVGLVDTLTEGATVWESNVTQIQLMIDALNNANAALSGTGTAADSTASQMSTLEIQQKAAEIWLTQAATAAIEATVGWDQLAESYEEVSDAAEDAAGTADDAAAAIATTPGRINPAQRALAAYAATIREVADAQEEVNQGQLDLRAAKEAAPELGAKITENRKKVFEIKQQQAEEDAREQERIVRESNQAIVGAVSELGNQISSAVSGAISGVNQDVIGQLLGVENAEQNAGEAVRRMAAVAAGGINNEWAPSLAAQLTGVQDATAQAFVTAFQAGDSGALQAAAKQLALNPILEMFDANLIAQQVEQQLRAQQLQQQLNDKVNAILGEQGLPAVVAVSQQVATAATDTGTATAAVQQSAAEMAGGAEAAGERIGTAFDGTLTSINTVIQRIELLIKLLERVVVVAAAAAGGISGLNPPAAGGNGTGVPTDADRRMGGSVPL